ncbi:MAG TPA: hypothetical protein VG294_03875 [Solirubrobacteraceae bacterium]|nr:hypothetical protein [Solirubrobacteraceae bacterium]
MKLVIAQPEFRSLCHALRKPEEVVFLYGTYADGAIEIDAVEIMTGTDIASRSSLHVELADDVRPRVIKTAWDTNRCLVEAHSHGDWGDAEFSVSDLHGFEDWVAHVRWRLRGSPYVALVKAGVKWDALAWIDDRATTIDAIEVIAGNHAIEALIPTNATAAKLAAARREH